MFFVIVFVIVFYFVIVLYLTQKRGSVKIRFVEILARPSSLCVKYSRVVAAKPSPTCRTPYTHLTNSETSCHYLHDVKILH